MDFALTIDSNGHPCASVATADSVSNAVLLSLHVRRGSFFLNPAFGSRLHEIKTLSDSEVALAKQYAAESLAWLVSIGKAQKVDVSATAERGGRLKLNIVLRSASGADRTYETFYKVV